MRELKFRVYDPEQKEMRYWGFIDGAFISPPLDSGALSWPSMQFTGLLDKNGKEIYEGDIVKHSYRSILTVVEWVDKKAQFSIGGYFNESIEVIGNVHEHPHLCQN